MNVPAALTKTNNTATSQALTDMIVSMEETTGSLFFDTTQPPILPGMVSALPRPVPEQAPEER